jgi:hypothetical protein
MAYCIPWLLPFVLLFVAQQSAISQHSQPPGLANNADLPTVQPSDNTPANVLSAEEWQRVDKAVNRALTWLASQQLRDGSFPTLDRGQPGVTCLCTLAFMSHGHLPGSGQYGKRLELAAEFALNCQKRNGLLALVGPNSERISRNVDHGIGSAGAYNHGIAGLTLSEMFGAATSNRNEPMRQSIEQAIRATLVMQRWPKELAVDHGGWRYLDDFEEVDSDLSVTGWQLKFLRSARNAGFDVPKQSIDDAVAYIRRTYSQRFGAFGYSVTEPDPRSRAMAGAGILALAHAGYHDAPEAAKSGDWILQHHFDEYNKVEPFTQDWFNDRYHYGVFHCCQGMYQLGGRHWEAFFPRVVKTLLANQQPNGSWASESHFYDAQFGSAYTTALVVLTLAAPNQLLPIYQR